MDISNLNLGVGGAFDKYTAQENANKKCKLCHGRGYVSIRYPKYNASVKDYCGCVMKKINKEEYATFTKVYIMLTVRE